MKRSMWVGLLIISIFSFIACTKYETEKLTKEDENELEQVRKIYVAKYDKKKEKFKLVEVLSNQPYSIEILDMLQGEYLEEKIETDRDIINASDVDEYFWIKNKEEKWIGLHVSEEVYRKGYDCNFTYGQIYEGFNDFKSGTITQIEGID